MDNFQAINKVTTTYFTKITENTRKAAYNSAQDSLVLPLNKIIGKYYTYH